MKPDDVPDIRCVVLDVDGVLTDGSLYTHDDGRGGRVFNVHDGFAIAWWLRLGLGVVICSGKESPAVAARAAELRIEHVIQGSRDKLGDLTAILPRLGVGLPQVAMIGDDLPDIPVLRVCGYPIAVANAVDEVKAAARYVTRRTGGQGAVREALEHLLRAGGRWSEVLAAYGVPAGPSVAGPGATA